MTTSVSAAGKNAIKLAQTLLENGRPIDVIPFEDDGLKKSFPMLPMIEARVYARENGNHVDIVFTTLGQVMDLITDADREKYDAYVKAYWHGMWAGFFIRDAIGFAQKSPNRKR